MLTFRLFQLQVFHSTITSTLVECWIHLILTHSLHHGILHRSTRTRTIQKTKSNRLHFRWHHCNGIITRFDNRYYHYGFVVSPRSNDILLDRTIDSNPCSNLLSCDIPYQSRQSASEQTGFLALSAFLPMSRAIQSHFIVYISLYVYVYIKNFLFCLKFAKNML